MRRTLLAITAVLLATIGTTLLYVYVSTADNRAKAQIERVTVLVATGDVGQGTSASALALRTKRQEVALFDETPKAIGNLNDVQGLVLTMNVLEGQQLTSRMFGKAAVGGLPTDHQAVSMTFGDVARVASLTKTGSRVDVVKLAGGAATVVLGDAKVLSVQGQIVTFDVPQEQVSDYLKVIAAGGQLILAYKGQFS